MTDVQDLILQVKLKVSEAIVCFKCTHSQNTQFPLNPAYYILATLNKNICTYNQYFPALYIHSQDPNLDYKSEQ